jgi:hypothetical protein
MRGSYLCRFERVFQTIKCEPYTAFWLDFLLRAHSVTKRIMARFPAANAANLIFHLMKGFSNA